MTNASDKRALNAFGYVVQRDPKKLDIHRVSMPVNTPCITPHCKGRYLPGDGGVQCSQCGRGTITKVVQREEK